MLFTNPDQPQDASKAVFGKDPRLDRTHTQEMEEYLEIHTVHGQIQRVKVPKKDTKED